MTLYHSEQVCLKFTDILNGEERSGRPLRHRTLGSFAEDRRSNDVTNASTDSYQIMTMELFLGGQSSLGMDLKRSLA